MKEEGKEAYEKQRYWVPADDDVKNLAALSSALAADAIANWQRCEKSQSDEPRRSFIRALFSYIEGAVWSFKQVALEWGARRPGILSRAEYAMLAEEMYEIKDDGSATYRPAKIQLARNLRFAFRVVCRVYGADYSVPNNDLQWSRFLKIIKVRNRIVHPKAIEDLTISDAEMTDARMVYQWFQGHLNYSLLRITQSLHEQAREFGVDPGPPRWSERDGIMLRGIIEGAIILNLSEQVPGRITVPVTESIETSADPVETIRAPIQGESGAS